MLVVDVQHGGVCPAPLSRPFVRAAVLAMLERGGVRSAEIDILLVRDGVMAEANARFMGCAGPTNVLSFPDECVVIDHGKNRTSMPIVAGSLLVSVDTLVREAMLFGKSVEAHALCLLAHGLGHLAGYDHGSAMDDFCDNLTIL